MTNAWAMWPLKPVAILATNTPATGYPLLNMTNDFAGVVYRSRSGLSSETLYVDLGLSPLPVDAALFFGCNGAKSGWTLTVSASDDFDGLVNNVNYPTAGFLAGAAFPTHGRGVGLWESSGAAITRRWWRYAFAGLAGDQLVIGRLAMGERLRLERNFGFGGAFGLRDLGKVEFSANAVMLRRRAPKLRLLGISFPSVRKDEVEEKVLPLVELAGGQEPIALVTDPEPHAQRQRRCWFGPLVGELGTIWPRPSGWEWRVGLIDLFSIPSAAPATFSPASLFNGVSGAWFDPSDLTTLFQDSAGTTPVTAAGQPVGKVNDKSGNGNHWTQVTAANRPTYQVDGAGKAYLSFDGSNDSLSATFNMVQPWERISALQQVAWAAGARLFSAATANAGELAQGGPGTPWLALVDGSFDVPQNNGLAVGANGVVAEIHNGTSSSLTINAGAAVVGNPGSAAVNGFRVGNRGASGSNFASMRLYGAVIREGSMTTAERNDLRTYMAAKAGVSL